MEIAENDGIAQALVEGAWRHAHEALEACRGNAWPEFARKSAPPAPAMLRTRNHRRCVEVASATFSGPRDALAEVIPVWVCEADETPASEWYAAHALTLGDNPLQIVETGPYSADADPCLCSRVRCQVKVWRVGVVVRTQAYAAGISMLAKHGDFGVLEQRVVLVTGTEALRGSAVDRPSLHVPAFSSRIELRVNGVPDELVADVRALSHATEE